MNINELMSDLRDGLRDELKDEYRKILVTANTLTVAFISLIEIIGYIIFIYNGMCDFSIKSSYLWFSVILPIFLNVTINFVVRKVDKSPKVSHDFKNDFVMYGICATACVVAIIHRDYGVMSGAYVFPIVLSASYNKKSLLNKTFYISIASLTITMMIRVFQHNFEVERVLNIMVAYGFAIVSYLAGYASIVFSRKYSAVIESQENENNQLQSMISRDQMTGLYNHRTFYSELDVSISISAEYNNDVCVAMIDVDNFKKVNDTYGHDRGDVVLKTLANLLARSCDESDKVCRYGGEEFAVVFNNKPIRQCECIMNRILEEFGKTKFDFTDASITFSCGIAQYQKNETRETLFNRADQCMYYAKNSGKNCVVALAM